MVANIPGLTTDYRAIASLYGILPFIAEAAPRPLLQALDQLIEGDGRKILPIFQDREADLFHSSSPHTGLLWALETIAWDPSNLGDAALALARLARIDPGGKLANRPIRSLREIFLVWHPSTNATMEQRFSAIDQIIRREPVIGWQLLVALLPEFHGVASPTSKPRYREAGASQAEVVTYGSIGKGYKQVVDRVLALVGDDPAKWVVVIKHLGSLSPADRKTAADLLEAFAKKREGLDNTELWAQLRKEVSRHRKFQTADWAMPDPDLQRLEAIVAALQPSDPVVQISWLFNEYSPDLPESDDIDQWKAVHVKRTDAMRQLYQTKGPIAVMELAATVKLPAQVGFAFANSADIDEIESLINMSLEKDPEPTLLSIAMSAGADYKFKTSWRARVARLNHDGRWTPDQTGRLVIDFSDDFQTWVFVESLGSGVDRIYWSLKGVRPIQDGQEALEFLAAKYLSHGRALAALVAVAHYARNLSSDTLFRVLDDSVDEVNSNPHNTPTNLSYEVEQILSALRSRADVPPLEIARREYAYLPLLELRQSQLTIHSLLAKDPDLFVSVLCDVFKPSTGEDREPTGAQRAKAAAGFRLLSEFHILPGMHDGNIDKEELTIWTKRVRELAAAQDRVAMADEYIGHVLAYSPTDPSDNAWPHRTVRDLIEDIAEPKVELGIRIERFNMRGTTMRGPFDGGDQERTLAAGIREWSKATVRWPRTTKLLQNMAAEWERHAQDEDVRARQDELRFS